MVDAGEDGGDVDVGIDSNLRDAPARGVTEALLGGDVAARRLDAILDDGDRAQRGADVPLKEEGVTDQVVDPKRLGLARRVGQEADEAAGGAYAQSVGGDRGGK